MAVKIRLARRGRKKLALYDVVVADARAPRDGRFIEKLGTYNPNTDPASINIDADRAFDWVMKGAQPTDTVRAILSYRGVMLRKHLQIGVNKGAITQEEADKRLEAWLKEKDAKIAAKVDRLQQDKASKHEERLAAERKVKEARAEAIKGKAAAAAAVATETTPATEEAPAEETAPAEPEEAPAAEEPAAEAADESLAETAEQPAATQEEPVAEVTRDEAPEVTATEADQTQETVSVPETEAAAEEATTEPEAAAEPETTATAEEAPATEKSPDADSADEAAEAEESAQQEEE